MRRLSKTDENLDDAKVQGWGVIKRVAPYLWPEGETWVKRRVVVAIVVLVLSKVIAVSTPVLYKQAVDALSPEGASAATILGFGAVGLTLAYGFARLMTVGFQQLRDVVFTKVGQRALRQLALETFTHIHRLSMRYHITRKTGGLS
ncbi:MAG: ABC-type multidrug transport system fused ATPase/permease subunit, partial [Yoonia sp.]